MAESNQPLPEPTHNASEAEVTPHGDKPAEGKLAHEDIKWETRDVPFRWVLIVSIAFVIIGSIIFTLVAAFFRAGTARLATRRESEFPLAEHPSNALPPEPRLEELDRLRESPRENVYVRMEAKEDRLNEYGTTAEKGFVHIPIRRAMERLAGHLPVRKEQPSTNKDYGLVDSGASNSGRMLRGAPR